MLNNVPAAVNSLTRNVVINHPNSHNAVIVRKRVTRVGGDTIGGLPTLGGLGVLTSEDEEAIEWDLMGNAYALETDIFTPGDMMDRRDTNNGGIDEFGFLIEPEEPIGMPGGFDIKKLDVMYLLITESIRLAYEVVGVVTLSNIPPYSVKFVCNRRDDLHIVV
ncbi:MAG: hypothetical protein WC856_02555 [Methylococcaceae bacterium]|jgi:hypothetical protein